MLYELAGIVGLEPGPLTLRELVWMAGACRRDAWERTSWLLALIANCNRDPKKRNRPFTPDEFNPLAEKKPGNAAISVGMLKTAFDSKL